MFKMIKTIKYKIAYNWLIEVIDLATAQSIKEDRDDDYYKLVICRYVLDDLYAKMCGYTEVIE